MNNVVIDPITRIEGHLRIEAQTDANGVIQQASSAGTMVRGIELVMRGRDPRDAWAFAQRICGVCTSSHSIASVRAVEDALAYPIPPNAEIIRNLINGAQFVHDHVVHFYHLHALDWVDVVSALDADPAATANLQQCTSDWHNNSTSYFADVKARLQAFVESGQIGIFTNGYWGHPEYKLPPELNLMAFAHYLEALAWQRNFIKVHAILGGRNPHPNFVVGGVPSAIAVSEGDTSLDGVGMQTMRDLIDEMRVFVDQVYLPDTLAIAKFYKDWATKGEGVGNFLTVGDFPEAPMDTIDPNAGGLLIPRGVILNRDLSTVHPLDLNDPQQVQELVSHSWYDYSAGKDAALHPYQGETNPRYTGPQPPYEHLDTEASYSWVKSPRWRGMPMEVGPLAHVLMMYAKDIGPTRALVDGALSELKLPLNAMFSTLGRVAARTIQTKILAESLVTWHQQLVDNIAAGDLRTHNDAQFMPATWPSATQGAGFMEAPRGALAHWVVINDGTISNYQCIVPTTWNAGPRDADGQEGPFEASLRGHTLHDPSQPLEILRTIHSFDPCMGCAVHLVGPDGNEMLQVKVL